MKQINSAIVLIVLIVLFTKCQSKNENEKGGLVIPEIKWELKQNLVNENGESFSVLTLENNSESDFSSTGWKIYFNYILTFRVDSISPFMVEHVNGDVRSLSPKAEFKGLIKGEKIEIPLYASGSVLSFTDAPTGFFIVYDEDPDKGINCPFEMVELPLTGLKRNNKDILPVHTAEITYEENIGIKKLEPSEFCPIIPTPKNYKQKKGELTLSNSITISSTDAFKNEAAFLKNKLSAVFSGKVNVGDENAQIILKESTNLGQNEEAYNLKITDKKIIIEAANGKGAFYGIQSLLALVPVELWKKPSASITFNNIVIEDEPRFEYRGIFLDVARNFQPKENVLKLLDMMAFYKLNKFHFHVCDDEGWRIEIPGLPELTKYGAWRGYSQNEEKYLLPSFGSGPIADEKVSHGCGFYTRDDFIEIVKYASERHIEVIPEIDMPGHARAAIKSMEKRYKKLIAENKENEAKEYLLTDFEDKSEYKSVQGWTDNVINVGMESSYNFLTKVTDELIKMFTEAGAKLQCIHTGGDEVPSGIWSKSPECDKILKENDEYSKPHDLSRYFIKRFAKILADRNIVAGGWEEIGLVHGSEIKPNPEFVGNNFRPYVWNNMWNSGAEDIGYQLANAGYPIVLANVTNLYFDLAYHKHPKEPGYYWGNFIDTKKAWEYTPMDLSKCAEFDRFGRPVDSENVIRKENQLTRKGEANVLGIQGLLWSENNLGLERLEYFMFPKLLGLAERAWAEQPSWVKKNSAEKRAEQKEAAWNEFVNTAGHRDFFRMDYLNKGIGYRVATPGAKIIDGMLYANVLYPGLTIRYETNGEEPSVNSPEYKTPVKVSEGVKLRAFTSSGRSSRTVEAN